MPTLSFSCPKCNKQHDRIKPEMIGHKVKCQCGFVFRIGAKASKHPGVVDELNRKKAIKRHAGQSNASAADSKKKRKPSSARPHSSPALPHALNHDIIDAIPVATDRIDDQPMDALPVDDASSVDDFESVEDLIKPVPAKSHAEPEILDAIPIESGSGTPNVPLMQIPTELLAPEPASGSPVRQPLTSNSPRSAAKRHRPMRVPPDQHLDSAVGPILTLALSALGLPILVWVIWCFAVDARDANEILSSFGDFPEQKYDTVKSHFVVSLMLCLMSVALAISMIASGVVAFIEKNKRIRIGWATKIASLLGGFLLVSLVLTCVWQVIAVFQFANEIQATDDQTGQTIDGSPVGFEALKIFVRYSLYGITPLAALVLGIWRNLRH